MKNDSQSDAPVTPEELEHALQLSSRLKTRFEILSPDYQRGYVDYISEPKKSSERTERVEMCIPFIMKLRDPKELED